MTLNMVYRLKNDFVSFSVYCEVWYSNITEQHIYLQRIAFNTPKIRQMAQSAEHWDWTHTPLITGQQSNHYYSNHYVILWADTRPLQRRKNLRNHFWIALSKTPWLTWHIHRIDSDDIYDQRIAFTTPPAHFVPAEQPADRVVTHVYYLIKRSLVFSSSMDIESHHSKEMILPFYSLLTPNTALKEFTLKWAWHKVIDVLSQPLDVYKPVPQCNLQVCHKFIAWLTLYVHLYSYWCWVGLFKIDHGMHKDVEIDRRH